MRIYFMEEQLVTLCQKQRRKQTAQVCCKSINQNVIFPSDQLF